MKTKKYKNMKIKPVTYVICVLCTKYILDHQSRVTWWDTHKKFNVARCYTVHRKCREIERGETPRINPDTGI